MRIYAHITRIYAHVKSGSTSSLRWEKPAKAAIDYFKLVEWLGASYGGYVSIRAAAFEPRIKLMISMPTSYSGLDKTLKQMRPGRARKLISP